MSDKQAVFVLLGGALSFVLGWLISGWVATSLIHDAGDDGAALWAFVGAVLFGIMGFVVSYPWVKAHVKAD